MCNCRKNKNKVQQIATQQAAIPSQTQGTNQQLIDDLKKHETFQQAYQTKMIGGKWRRVPVK